MGFYWKYRVQLTACDSYFTILVNVFMNHILTENTYLTNYVL